MSREEEEEVDDKKESAPEARRKGHASA